MNKDTLNLKAFEVGQVVVYANDNLALLCKVKKIGEGGAVTVITDVGEFETSISLLKHIINKSNYKNIKISEKMQRLLMDFRNKYILDYNDFNIISSFNGLAFIYINTFLEKLPKKNNYSNSEYTSNSFEKRMKRQSEERYNELRKQEEDRERQIAYEERLIEDGYKEPRRWY